MAYRRRAPRRRRQLVILPVGVNGKTLRAMARRVSEPAPLAAAEVRSEGILLLATPVLLDTAEAVRMVGVARYR